MMAIEESAGTLDYEPAAPEPEPRPLGRGDAVLALLTVGTTALAGLLLWRGLTTWLEAISFVTGAVCVWLTVRENIWNFPIGMLNGATFAFVFFRARLFADAGLQVVYFVLGGIGWYLWLYGGKGRTALPITRAPARRAAGVGLAIAVLFAGEYVLLRKLGGSAPFW